MPAWCLQYFLVLIDLSFSPPERIELIEINIEFFSCLVRSSSTEPPSIGDPDPGSVYIEKEGRSRGYGEALFKFKCPNGKSHIDN